MRHTGCTAQRPACKAEKLACKEHRDVLHDEPGGEQAHGDHEHAPVLDERRALRGQRRREARGAVQMQKTAERIDNLTARLVASLFSVP